ncbi:MAG: pyridoxamine 5'-phosphate oxidase family protein [Acidimicrobiales bacterium]
MSDAIEIEDERTGLLVMTEAESIELLETTAVGRVVFIDGAYPIALPVNYKWVDRSVVFRALEGKKLHAAIFEEPVSFEVDEWDPQTQTGASVLVRGRAAEVTDWAEKEELEDLGVIPWTGHPWRQSWIRIVPKQMSGRRIA